jgi:hypothetical protein
MVYGLYLALGIDVPHSVPNELGFFLAVGAAERLKLAVSVGGVHYVAVDDREPPNARPSQKFNGKAADAPQSDHEHVRPNNPFQGFGTYQKFRAFEPVRNHGRKSTCAPLLVSRYWFLVFGFSFLVFSCWFLVPGFRLLVSRFLFFWL